MIVRKLPLTFVRLCPIVFPNLFLPCYLQSVK